MIPFQRSFERLDPARLGSEPTPAPHAPFFTGMPLLFRPLQAVSVRIADADPPEWYPSLVVDFNEGKELMIGIPTQRGMEIAIQPGAAVILEVTLPDGLRRMTTRVRGRDSSSPPSLVLDWPQVEERIQRRNDVRVETMFNAELFPVQSGGKLGQQVKGLVADLSAGGCRVFTNTGMPVGTEVMCTLQLPGIGARDCDGKVVRGGLNTAQSTSHPHWVGVMFTDPNQPVRREITKLIFDIQREMLRKGIR